MKRDFLVNKERNSIKPTSVISGSWSTLLSPSLGESATPYHLRAYNLSIILRYILAGQGSWSRADIAAKTGITRATVSRLVDELVGYGLVQEKKVSVTTTRGRPATLLSPKPGRVVAIGSEVSLSGLSFCAVDLSGKVIAVRAYAKNYSGWSPDEIFVDFSRLLHELHDEVIKEDTLYLGAGVAIPGVIDNQGRVTSYALDWFNLDPGDILSSLSDVSPMLVGNTGSMAAYALTQPLPGVFSGPGDFIYLSTSDVVSSGIVLSHQVYGGGNGRPASIDHLSSIATEKSCKCGSHGCVSSYLATPEMLASAGLPQDSKAEDILAAALQGSEQAQNTIELSGKVLGCALGNVVNLFDIQSIILNGDVSVLWPEIKAFAETELSVRLQYIDMDEISIEHEGQRAGLASRGIAHRVLSELVANPAYWLDNPDRDFTGVVEWAGC